MVWVREVLQVDYSLGSYLKRMPNHQLTWCITCPGRIESMAYGVATMIILEIRRRRLDCDFLRNRDFLERIMIDELQQIFEQVIVPNKEELAKEYTLFCEVFAYRNRLSL